MFAGGIVNEEVAWRGMRCNKCGAESPDRIRFCPVCGHKLQSGRENHEDAPDEAGTGDAPRPASRLLDFQGWARPGRGGGRYVEACVYAALLGGGVAWFLYSGVQWPLYPLVALCALAVWLRRL